MKRTLIVLIPALFLSACSAISSNTSTSSPAKEFTITASTAPETSTFSRSPEGLTVENIQDRIEQELPAHLAEQAHGSSSTYMVYCPEQIPAGPDTSFSCDFDSDFLYGEIIVTLTPDSREFTWVVKQDTVESFSDTSSDSYIGYDGMTAEEVLAVLPALFDEEWGVYPLSQQEDLCLYFGKDPYAASSDYADELLTYLSTVLTAEQMPARLQVKQLWEVFMEETCYTYGYR